MEDRLELVRTAVVSFNRGDYAAFAGIFDPNVVLFADPQVAERPEYRGHAGVMEWISEASMRWDGVRFHVVDVSAAAEHTLVELGVVGEAGSGGGAWRLYVLMRWRGTLVDWLRSYPTRRDALVDAGVAEVAS
jgi:ketosteroid isomerase-like protein